MAENATTFGLAFASDATGGLELHICFSDKARLLKRWDDRIHYVIRGNVRGACALPCMMQCEGQDP